MCLTAFLFCEKYYFKIYDNLKNNWKTSFDYIPILVLQFKTQISGRRYVVTPFCLKKSRNIKFLTKTI